MKLISKLLLFVFISSGFQCSKNNSDDTTVTREVLNQKKSNIQTYINSFDCSQASSCMSMAFGSKPCGGPWEYIVFPNTVDIDALTQMVNEYNELEHQYNIETGAISDCAVVGPPSQIECVNGECTIIN